ncbi:MAG: hypothetical protein AABZ32_04000, partial [Bacteroidota bacterium]
MAKVGQGFIPSEDAKFSTWSENFRAKLLEILEAFGLIRQVGGSINGGATINLAQGPFTPDIRIRAKNDGPMPPVDIIIGLGATASAPIELATGGK